MFSLSKLLLLLLILAVIWAGWRWIKNFQSGPLPGGQPRDSVDKKRSGRSPFGWPGDPTHAPAPDRITTEDTVQCPVCKAYLPVNHTSGCGRSDCPYDT